MKTIILLFLVSLLAFGAQAQFSITPSNASTVQTNLTVLPPVAFAAEVNSEFLHAQVATFPGWTDVSATHNITRRLDGGEKDLYCTIGIGTLLRFNHTEMTNLVSNSQTVNGESKTETKILDAFQPFALITLGSDFTQNKTFDGRLRAGFGPTEFLLGFDMHFQTKSPVGFDINFEMTGPYANAYSENPHLKFLAGPSARIGNFDIAAFVGMANQTSKFQPVAGGRVSYAFAAATKQQQNKNKKIDFLF